VAGFDKRVSLPYLSNEGFESVRIVVVSKRRLGSLARGRRERFRSGIALTKPVKVDLANGSEDQKFASSRSFLFLKQHTQKE